MKRRILFFLAILFLFSACEKEWPGQADWQRIEMNVPGRIHDIYFVNDTLGFACGGHRFYNAFILKTTDAGATWQVKVDDETTPGLFNLSFYNENHGIAVGYSGGVWRTQDSGETWARWQHQNYSYFQSSHLLDSSDFVLLAGDGFNSGEVWYPSGSNWWVTSSVSFDESLTCSYRFADGHFLAAGYGAMYTSPNARDWQPLDVDGDFFLDMDFLQDENTGLVCGFDGSVIKTQNGGSTWENVRNSNRAFTGNEAFYAIDLHENGNGIVAGLGGAVYVTDAFGDEWYGLNPPEEDNFFSVATPDGNTFFLGAENGVLYGVTLQP